MRVLQLIDSLRPGGAEKMSVSIANALVPHVEGSYLCCTRQEGLLKDEVKPEVGYLFLNKKSRFDPKAFMGLRNYINKNKIDIVHAHSTSFFLAGLLKLSGSNFNLVWHDHYGDSENLEERDSKVLKKFSRLFSGVISVNTALKEWALQNLNCKNVIEIKNFISDPVPASETKIQLKGNANDFKIICVANLRPQKDHITLLKAFEKLDPEYQISLHLIGEDPQTDYSKMLLKTINNSTAKNKIFFYGAQPEINNLLAQADLGILSSRSEGLPLALLEYGSAGIPVICTSVGKCTEVIGLNGKLFKVGDVEACYNAMVDYFKNPNKRINDSNGFQKIIKQEYSANSNIEILVDFYFSKLKSADNVD